MTKSPLSNLRSSFSKWSLAIALLILTWGLRLCCLEAVPPGWRDDELINIHALSGELLAGRFPLYFTGASGHEPLYHYLHAGVHAVLGFNVLSGHILSVACGTLTVALTYTLTRCLFGRTTAVVASLALGTSFWSLMYSRTAIRHISVLPFALAAFHLLWRSITCKSQVCHLSFVICHSLLGLLVGASLYTYPAARLLPVLLVLFAAYLALFHRSPRRREQAALGTRPGSTRSVNPGNLRSYWRGLLITLAIAAVLALPLGIAIAQGRSEAAAQGIGADARLAELAVPLRELRAGNPRPLLETAWTTLGMFHATGDPEWLYNIPNRPVFNLLGGALLWAGVALCLWRWRQPRHFFLLLWFALGLLPAFVSTPPASLSHTILAQPAAYILPALALTEARSRISNLKPPMRLLLLLILHCSLFIFLAANAYRDLRDYFTVWPQQSMVRFLYRADYRDAARYLDAHPEITDVAISSTLLGPWDRLALEVDTQRDDVNVRLFNPERALLWTAGDAPSTVLLTSFPRPAPPIDGFLEEAEPPETISPHLTLYAIRNPQFAICNPQSAICNLQFTNGLELLEARWVDEEPLLLTTWLVAAPLDLPPMPIVANPPPPGVYSGPRLAIFTHLLAADGTFLVGDDGLWVDPLTLRPGDRFVQIHRFALPPAAPAGPYVLELGLYDPRTGERWPVLGSDGQPGLDRLLIPIEEGP